MHEPVDLGCPDWCETRISEHDGGYDHEVQAFTMDHEGPTWGPHVSSYGSTLANTDRIADSPHIFVSDVPERFDDPEQLRELAANLTAAAGWLERVALGGVEEDNEPD